MISVSGLVTAMSGPTNERRQRRTRRSIAGAMALFLLVAGLGFTALAAWLIWSVWQAPTPATDGLLSAVVRYALAAWAAECLIVLTLTPSIRSDAATRQVVVALRALLARHDDQLTPLARFQPAPDAATAAMPLPLTLRPVRFGAPRKHPALFGVFWAFVAIGASATICARTTWPSSAATPYPPLLAAALFGFIALAVGAPALARLRSRVGARRCGPKLILDERGIHTGAGERFTLAWDQIRGLWQVVIAPPVPTITTPDFAPALDAHLMVYLADDGVAPLLWWMNGTASAAEVKASEALLRQIVARTGHPLRDATALVHELMRQGSPESREMFGRFVRGGSTGSIGQAVREALPQPPAERKRSPLTITAIAVIATLLALANAALPVGEFRLESAHTRFAANSLATMRASRPIYATDFHDNGGIWRDYPATAENIRGYQFAGGAYHLTGTLPDRFVASYYRERTGDVAVEATVAMRVATGDTKLYGVGGGVAVHAVGEDDTMLAYYVDTDGYWDLLLFAPVDDHASDNWRTLDGGYSPAIHKGLGAENTVLFIQVQRHITLYVNGSRVLDTTYSSDNVPNLPLEGYTGVYSDQSGMDATFTHFALYRPLTPPDFWEALRTG